jgi:carbamoyl-phosphate synthase large subunit
MGMDENFGLAFMKSQFAAGQNLPNSGSVFISVNDRDKPGILGPARTFAGLGFEILATGGTAEYLEAEGVKARRIYKVYEGQRPHVVDHIKSGDIDLMINTASGKKTQQDSRIIRQSALLYRIPYATTVAGARAMVQAVKECCGKSLSVKSLQEYYDGSS